MADHLIDEGVDEIPIPGANGATVTMKRQATYEDELAVQAAMPVGADRDILWRAFVPARTMVMIESWTLQDADGSPLPITELILLGQPTPCGKRLPRRMARFIVNEAQRRYDGEDEEQEGPLGSPSPGLSPETRSTTLEP